MDFTYEIAGKTYRQRPLVLGQIRQLLDLLQGVSLPENITPVSIMAALGARMATALAIALTPAGVALKDKDPEALAREIEFELSPETAIQVIEDFFDCNPIVSLLEKIGAMAETIKRKTSGSASKTSSVTSQEETSPKETASSGDIP